MSHKFDIDGRSSGSSLRTVDGWSNPGHMMPPSPYSNNYHNVYYVVQPQQVHNANRRVKKMLIKHSVHAYRDLQKFSC